MSQVEETKGAKPKVPNTYPAADIREKSKVKEQQGKVMKKSEVNTTLEEVVDSWDNTPVPDPDPRLTLSPPRLPQRPRPQRPQTTPPARREEKTEEVKKTPVKTPPSLMSLATSPGFEIELDMTIPMLAQFRPNS